VNVLYRRELAAAADPAAMRATLVAEFREKLANPFIAASRGFIDEIVRPRETRPKLAAALASCDSKRASNPPKKHGNIPL
jgi:propionyl-CoA carboxylase beta chain